MWSKPNTNAWFALTGFGALLLTHLLWLGSVGGFHYDEAWAALFSHKIATTPGFWPVHAMSPYTSAWSHYVAAAFFKLFGTDLFVYRASGVFLVASGVAMLSLALCRAGRVRAAATLPWVIAFSPALLLNHRFAIEINTFHVFCLGLFCWGASFKLYPRGTSVSPWISDIMIAAAVLLGVSSHVLFVGPALAAIAIVLWQGTASLRLRLLVGWILVALFGFFLQIHMQIPEKDKSLALLLLATACFAGISFPAMIRHAPKPLRKVAVFGMGALLIPSLLLVLFFSEGSWSEAFFSGGIRHPGWIGWTLLAPTVAAAVSWRKLRVDSRLSAWIALSWIAVAALAVKPAPRYFEIPLLLAAVSFALMLEYASRKVFVSCLSIWILTASLQLGFNYFEPALQDSVRERSFHFLIFRDNSSDTLPKQKLALEIGRQGCRFEQVVSDDPRLLEPLRFLAIGDWPVSPDAKCPASGVAVFRQPSAQSPFAIRAL